MTRYCFVPNCRNDSNNCPDKIFVRIREDLRKKWCHEVNTKYYYNISIMYCCEDHIDPYEDLKNYHKHKLMNDEPVLKPTAKLRNITPKPSLATLDNEAAPFQTELSNLSKSPKKTNRRTKKKKLKNVTPSTSALQYIPIKPYVDLKNYHEHKLLNDEPVLKPTAKLWNILPKPTLATLDNKAAPFQTESSIFLKYPKIFNQRTKKKKLKNVTPSTSAPHQILIKVNGIKPLSTGLVFEDDVIDSLNPVIKMEEVDLNPDYIACDNDGHIEMSLKDEQKDNSDILVDTFNYETNMDVHLKEEVLQCSNDESDMYLYEEIKEEIKQTEVKTEIPTNNGILYHEHGSDKWQLAQET